ncbi:MAG: hypothetical protein AAFP84_01575 [Actinomycetota bacterium]
MTNAPHDPEKQPEHDELLARLAQADPMTTTARGAIGAVDDPTRSRARAALFEEITMTNTTTSSATRTPSTTRHIGVIGRDDAKASNGAGSPPPSFGRPSIWRRPALAGGVLAGAAAVAIGAVLVVGDGSPSAHASVIAAAERSAQFDSGNLVLEMNVESVDGSTDESVDAFVDYRFENGDYTIEWTTEVPGRSDTSRFAFVDGRSYVDDGTGWIDNTEVAEQLGIDTADFFFGSSRSLDPQALVAIVEAADDVERADVSDGTERFTGTVPAADVLGLDPDDLPIGLALMLSGEDPAGSLPDEIGLVVDVRDGIIDSLDLVIDGDTRLDGEIVATVSTEYRSMGKPQLIEAPIAPLAPVAPTDD